MMKKLALPCGLAAFMAVAAAVLFNASLTVKLPAAKPGQDVPVVSDASTSVVAPASSQRFIVIDGATPSVRLQPPASSMSGSAPAVVPTQTGTPGASATPTQPSQSQTVQETTETTTTEQSSAPTEEPPPNEEPEIGVVTNNTQEG